MSDMMFGNCWHGKVTPDGLLLDDLTLKTSVPGGNAEDGTTNFPYQSDETGYFEFGHTYYYKTPGIGTVTTPSILTSIGAAYKNDAIFFGQRRRYSPFRSHITLGPLQWIHCDSVGTWRIMNLSISSTGSTSSSIQISRGQKFGQLNRDIAYENNVIANITLYGRTCSAPELSEIDVRNDGRQIVIHLRGTWSNLIDPAIAEFPDMLTFDNYSHKAIAAAWTIDINEDCDEATATRVFLAEDPEGDGSFDRTWYVPDGDVFYEGTHYWQPVIGVKQLNFDSTFEFERLIGAGYSSDGTLHLIKYSYRSDMTGYSANVSGIADLGFSSDPFVPSADEPVWKSGSFSQEYVDPSIIYTINVVSNSTTLKTITDSPDPIVWSRALTNNVFDLRNNDGSFCRVGPGAIDDTAVSGSTPPFASFNHRAGEVVSSETEIAFV